MSNELATIKRNELTESELAELNKMLADNPDILKSLGSDDIQQDDMARPPYMKISSRGNPVESPDGTEITPGHLVIMPATTINAPMFDVVIIASTPNTYAWLGDFSKGEPPVCLSDESGMFPIAQGGGRIVTDPKPGPCRKPDNKGRPRVYCPHADWGDLDPETGKNAKPECRKQLGFVLWPLDVMGRRRGLSDALHGKLLRRAGVEKPGAQVGDCLPRDDNNPLGGKRHDHEQVVCPHRAARGKVDAGGVARRSTDSGAMARGDAVERLRPRRL